MNRFGEMHCSIAQAVGVIGEPWTPLILRDLFMGLRRFDELAQDLGISRNLLTARLERLVEAGVVERRPYQERPVRFEYHLAEAGREIVPALITLMAWGDKWSTPPGGPPALLRHSCGQQFTPVVTCPHCGGEATADTITVMEGPGAAQGPGTMVLAAPQGS
ncbi:winged helix-turn-helix transcriptional regulator [Nonomuraea africana]|uniref:DNA-binding HxlR family transcriptional regulator n=1 Tax=Nonomuraea africana TaxID=46171 RepID=A0ABR9KFZ8_9ACTN|nr:helix-turn-helix domain-containing protein [Nonomuraea africana]MBE1560578.1 DNA-binding HxlR family transcriptional regulator [Nonomuraea africana]